MKIMSAVVLAVVVGYGSAAQAQSGAQASASPGSSTSLQAGPNGAEARSGSSGGASAEARRNSASLASGTAMNAALSEPVDAKKNKPGDPVTAKTTEATKSEGKVVIPKGTKLLGHVTECRARSKEEKESVLGIVFDKAILKNGEQIPLNVTIQALAAAQTAVAGSVDEGELGGAASGRASGGTTLGGVKSTAGGAAGAVTNTAANAGAVAGGAAHSTTNAAGAAVGAAAGPNAAGQPRRHRARRVAARLGCGQQHTRVGYYVDEQECTSG
jgi:hypothetical protein